MAAQPSHDHRDDDNDNDNDRYRIVISIDRIAEVSLFVLFANETNVNTFFQTYNNFLVWHTDSRTRSSKQTTTTKLNQHDTIEIDDRQHIGILFGDVSIDAHIVNVRHCFFMHISSNLIDDVNRLSNAMTGGE